MSVSRSCVVASCNNPRSNRQGYCSNHSRHKSAGAVLGGGSPSQRGLLKAQQSFHRAQSFLGMGGKTEVVAPERWTEETIREMIDIGDHCGQNMRLEVRKLTFVLCAYKTSGMVLHVHATYSRSVTHAPIMA